LPFIEAEVSLSCSQQPASGPYPEPEKSSPHLSPISPRFILISSHLCLDLPRGLFPSSFPTKILYAILISSLHATCHTHLIHFTWNMHIHIFSLRHSLLDKSCSTLYNEDIYKPYSASHVSYILQIATQTEDFW